MTNTVLICRSTLESQWLTLLRLEVKQSPTAASVKALGVVGSVEDLPGLIDIAENSDENSDIFSACINAVSRLDIGENALRVAVRGLSVDSTVNASLKILSKIGTNEALTEIYNHFVSCFDANIASFLLYKRFRINETVSKIQQYILESSLSVFLNNGYSDIWRLFRNLSDADILASIFGEARVREVFHRAATDSHDGIWFVGSQVNAIKCLHLFSPEEAFTAAVGLLQRSKGKDREKAPSLIMQINQQSGIKVNVRQHEIESDSLVRLAIELALEDQLGWEFLHSRIHSPEIGVAKSAVSLAGWSDLTDVRIDAELNCIIANGRNELVTLAVESKQKRRQRKLLVEVCTMIHDEPDSVRRRLLINIAASCCSAGISGTSLNHQLKSALSGFDEVTQEEIKEIIKDRRRRLAENHKRAALR